MVKRQSGPINDNDAWGTSCRNELYTMCNELDIVKMIKIGRLRWLGHFFRMQELDPCGKLCVLRPEGT